VNWLHDARPFAHAERGSGGFDIDLVKVAIYKLEVLALVSWFAGALQQSCFSAAAERQATRMRIAYFKSIASQDVTWCGMCASAYAPIRPLCDAVAIGLTRQRHRPSLRVSPMTSRRSRQRLVTNLASVS
jgi:hypothetical protein